MREMKDSGVEWIGEIPVNWKVDKIKHHFTVLTGTTPKSDEPEMWDGDIVWVTPADFKTDDVYVEQGHRNISENGFISNSLTIIPAGNIIFSKRAPIGQVVINSVDLCTNQGCLSAISFDKSETRYYRYLMIVANEEFELSGSGTTFKEISASSFCNTLLPHPDTADQIRIADYLDSKCAKIDEIIAKQEQIIEKLKEYKLSVITEAVTKGLDPDVEMKDSGSDWIGTIPLEWEVGKTLYALEMSITDGPHETPELFEDGIPFVSAEAVSCGNGYIDFDHIRGYISQEFYEECCKKYIPQINDIYMIKSGATTGRVAIVDTERCFTIWSPLAVFRCNCKKMYYMYLYYFLQSDVYQKQVQDKWTFGTQQNIGMRSLEKLIICFPPLEEQILIADYLDTMCSRTQDEIKKRNQIINKLQEYKKSLIYEVVTGKKEV